MTKTSASERTALTAMLSVGIAALSLPTSAVAQSFGPATPMIDTNYLSGMSASALDFRGNAVAVWRGAGSYRAPGGSWTAPAAVAASEAPIVHMTASGLATQVSADAQGIWVQDMRPGGIWRAAQRLVPASAGMLVDFVMNARGDAMIVYGTKAVRRAAGTTHWSKVETVAAVPAGTNGIRIDRVALGSTGDAVVTFESYVTKCGRRSCYNGSYILYAAREGGDGAGFTLSAPITSSPLLLTEHHDNRATVDANGLALVAYEDVDRSGARLLRSVTQPRGTIQWNAPVTIYTHPYQQAHALSASVDTNSLASVLYFDVASSTYAVVDGSLRTNSWAAPVALSASDPTAQAGGATASNGVGSLVLGWTSSNGAIQAMLRPRSGAGWSPVQTVAPYDPTCSPTCTAINSAAINDNGQAIVTWSKFDSTNEAFSFDAATNN